MNKKVFVFSLVIFLGLLLAIYQYAEEMQADLANAYSTSKPANGHSWDEMECTAGLCLISNKVGIGTDNPTEKLEVNGDILVLGDACNGDNFCLNDLEIFK